MSSIPLIAIVEDDESMQHALVGLIRSFGFHVCEFASAEQFLASDQLDHVDCVTTDVQMGAINGYELTRRLLQRRADLPVIIITARRDEHMRDKIAACGAVCLLHKPFEAAALNLCITNALDGP